ncbi:MAG: HD domain-containing protein [Treponema sp.]|nr:HD domain-containing protein [Treponema sp.]
MTSVIHPILKEIASLFNNGGKEIYLVGGAVRDMLRGKKIHDWDLATNALPEEVTAIVKRAGGRVVPTGVRHGTVTVFYKKHNAEITTFRTESGYSDGRRPDHVHYTTDIEEDLSRRDFTMNAVALSLPSGEIIDPFGGKADIRAGVIRCVGEAGERFNEDGLRPLRAVRFAAQLGFEIEQTTQDAIGGALSVSAKVSQERVRDEIDKILASPLPSRAFLLMEKTGLLELFLEELAVCRGIEQKGYHRFDVLDHSLLACDYSAANGYSHELRLSALLHDVGKPCVRRMDESGVWTFYRHEETSSAMCRKILARLRYSNAVTDRVCHLVKEHMFHYTDEWSDSAVRRFIARAGESNLEDLYRLRRADAYAFSGKEPDSAPLLLLINRVNKILAGGRAFTVKDISVNGNDLMEAGIPSGKKMGVILNELLETVLDDPQQNTKEKLLEIAGKIYRQTAKPA